MNKIDPRIRDLTGQRWGRLTVLSYSHSEKTPKKNSTYAVWNVRCDCGTEKKLIGSNITKKHSPTRSCGCLIQETQRKTKRKPLHYAEYTNLFYRCKTKSKARGLEFSLTRNEFVAIVKKDCSYCGSKPSNVCKSNYPDVVPDLMYSGIDRIDSSQGYIKGNTVPCCKHCNHAKMDMDLIDFYNHIEKMHNHLKKNTAPLFTPIKETL